MVIAQTAELEACLEVARASGCSEDQAGRFLSYGYVPQPKQWLFHAAARACDLPGGPTMVGLGGARGPGKSHAILAQIGMDDCQRREGLKFLFLRKIQKAAKESMEDLIGRVFRYLPHTYKPSESRILFPNGSRIIIGGFKDEKEIAGYLGIEYDGIAIEEATLISESKLDMLLGSMRTSRDDWRARMYLSTNPGGVGHNWFKQRLVIPMRQHTETGTRFIFSTYRDNAFLSPEYRAYLENLKGPLGKAWRDGDFDVFEGQAFPTWDYDAHVIDPFEIPEEWTRWRSIDWGFSAPMCCLWHTRNPDTKRIYTYRELYRTMLTTPRMCDLIKEYTPPAERIAFTYADPSMWSKKNVGNIVTTTADEFRSFGVPLTRADNDRLSGKRKVDEALGNLPDGLPGLQIFSTVENLIRTLPILTFDPHNPEDVDTAEEDHAYDGLRYGLTNMKLATYKPAPPPPNPWNVRKH
jgi:phage terminase large subunit